MPNITLLHSPTCGACPSAKRLWKELRVKYSFSYREVDITTPDGQELANRHSVRAVPATIIDGRLTFVGVPPRQSAEKALQLKMKPQGVRKPASSQRRSSPLTREERRVAEILSAAFRSALYD